MSSKMIKLYDKNGNWCQPMTNHLISSGVIDGGKDFNNFLAQGEYNVSYDGIGDAPLNAPYSGIIWGKLFVEVNDNNIQNNSTNWLWQTFIDTSRRIYKRQKINNTSFTPWRRIYEETILYDNQSGTKGTITLTNSASDFNYLEIYYRRGTNDARSTRVENPDGKEVGLSGAFYAVINGARIVQLRAKIIGISGNTITVKSDGYVNFYAGGGQDGPGEEHNGLITRVIGYR